MKELEVTPNKDSEMPIGELAEVLGISLRSAQRLAQSGLFVSIGRKQRGGKNYYKLGASVQAYIGKLKKDFEEKGKNKDVDALKANKLKAEIELKLSQGELHQLKTSIAKGDYVSVDDVKLDYQRFFLSFKKFAMAIPDRVGGLITGYVDPIICRGIEKDMQQEISQMLNSFVVAGQKLHNGDEK